MIGEQHQHQTFLRSGTQIRSHLLQPESWLQALAYQQQAPLCGGDVSGPRMAAMFHPTAGIARNTRGAPQTSETVS